jgi:hypothetical protein
MTVKYVDEMYCHGLNYVEVWFHVVVSLTC